jgi:hypothetical protein
LLAGTLDAPVTLVHVIHRRKDSETQTKDYEFSHLSMTEHWQAGGADMGAALQLLGRQGARGEFRVLDHPDAPMARHPPAVTSKETRHEQHDVRAQAWAMPLTSPIYPRGPYRRINREFMVISYRTDPALLMPWCPRRWARARRHRQDGVHPHARLHRLWRLHRVGQVIPSRSTASPAPTRTTCS